MLPPYALVGLITFGTVIQIHELGFNECPKSYVFRGSKEYSSKQIQENLGLPVAPAPGQPMNASGSARFLCQLQECEFNLTTAIEQLKKDPWPVANDKRPIRSTGGAISLAIGLLEATFPNTGARILVFNAGACTQIPGIIVSPELKEPIRSHNDIEKDTALYYRKSYKFYEDLAKRAATNGHTVDLFSGCLDQVGLAEMRSLSGMTGGVIVLADSFGTSLFKQSLSRLFDKDQDGFLLMGLNSSFEVLTSKELRISGLIGSAISTNKKTPNVSETEIGIGMTSSWKIPALDKRTTLAVYFEMAPQNDSNGRGVIQFHTFYQHTSGQFRLRVTTVARNIVEATNPQINQSFDQESAAVLMARIAVYKGQNDDGPDVLRWLDRMLIRLCQKVGEYRQDDPASFRLSHTFSIYPQFMFHLRRSQFLQVFNNSPDETAFYRHAINTEDTNNSLIMIQPTLTAYLVGQEPMPVLLDACSINPEAILLLDTFFHILIWHGEVVASWRDNGFLDNPDYAHLKDFFDAPPADAQDLLMDRFPLPRYVVCDQNGSQARFLLSKLNPSQTHSNSGTSQAIFTDDVNLQSFMDYLRKLVTTTSS
ncbi:Sec23/Sec24, trunk domain-containing protein [Rozella allomycis CSF55]|nr:Sec23/Sec24, trunk domain-containing protein [Rozella allomycis CSF55]|eukprot:EPZ32639.1 Sec23/Sec24, trunk domain-containing protein [Rozella allomycis CSF55]